MLIHFTSQNKRGLWYLLFASMIILASWTRWYYTGNLEADNNFILNSTWGVWQYFIFYTVGFWGMVWCYYKIVIRADGFNLSMDETIALSRWGFILFYFMTVIFASDIYTYLAEGELATRGIFTYTDGSRVEQSRFIHYVSHWWKDCPNHYGPPLLFIFWLSVKLGQNVLTSYFILKGILLLIAILYTEVIRRLYKDTDHSQYNLIALVLLAPILLLEGVGQTHVEIVIALFMAIGLWSFKKKHNYLFISMIALAIACKVMYASLLIPLLICMLYVEYMKKQKQIAKFIGLSAVSIILIIAIVGIVYIPVWESIDTLMHPIRYHSTKTPSRSFTEIAILVYKYGREILVHGHSIPELQIMAHRPDFFPISEVLNYQSKIAPFFKWLGILLAGWNILPLYKEKDWRKVFHIFAKIWIIVITIYSPIFNPWYYIPVLLLMGYTDVKSWVIYAIFVVSQSINGQLGNSTIPPGHPLEIFSSIQVLSMAPLFLIYFKKHFILETWNLVKK